MPAYVYAAQSGTVTSICRGQYNLGVVVTGSLELGYWHLTPSTSINVGDTFQKGQLMGPLQYGSFNESCGHATQNADTYHIHFAFPGGSDLSIGGCTLSISTGYFTCGTTKIGVNGLISNSGSSGDNPNPPGQSGEIPVLSGSHVWDGLVAGLMDIVNSVTSGFPTHVSAVGGTGTDISTAIDNSVRTIMDMVQLVVISNLFYILPLVAIIGITISLEGLRALMAIWRWIIDIIRIE